MLPHNLTFWDLHEEELQSESVKVIQWHGFFSIVLITICCIFAIISTAGKSLIIYFILDGLTNPSFTDFQYYFYMNVLGLSNRTFALIQLVSFICAIFGVLTYEAFLKGVEVRMLLGSVVLLY